MLPHKVKISIICIIAIFSLLTKTNYAHSKIELSGGYVRYIPLNKNWTGESHSGYSGEGPDGFTDESNGVSTSISYSFHRKYGLRLEILYWRQRLVEFAGCWILPSHTLTIIPVFFTCRIESFFSSSNPVSRLNPYFDIGGGMYFQNLTSGINDIDSELSNGSGVVGGFHIGLGVKQKVISIIHLDIGGRIFFANKTPDWTYESSIPHKRINFDGALLRVNTGINF